MLTDSSYKPYGLKERIFLKIAKMALLAEKKWPKLISAPPSADIDIYASSMPRDFNFLHNIIYPHFFKKIHVESENIDLVRELAVNSTIVYVTKDIGQLEYNFFNYLFLTEGLPLARFVNELSLWKWLPFKQLKYIALERARRFKELGPLPHPVSSGYAGAVIKNGYAVFLQLKSTAIYNDLYWYTPQEDPLTALLAVQEREQKPIYAVPLHFMWDKRPEKSSGSFINLLPKHLTKTIIFWKNYKNRAIVTVGGPIRLSEFISGYAAQPLPERARRLRAELLNLLKQEKKVITGPPLKPRSWIIDELLEDETLQKTYYDVSLERKSTIDDVKTLAKKYAGEIAADINYNYIEIGWRIMRWVLKNIYNGIVINADGLNKLKKASAKAPVILVPNHRSHMDYLLLSTILYENNVSIPHVAAGLNMAFWPMGYIFKRCGAFFLRRTFSGNKLYRAVFKSYLKILLKEGYCQEFFIEGGRSRTGKLLRPRTGMLAMLTESMREGTAKEAYFVPVAITYDKIIEEYKKELSGETKKSERTRDLLSIGKYLRKKYGQIYVKFGEPIAYADTEGEINEKVPMLANSITVTINREMTATPSAVTASAILISSKRGITRNEILSNTKEIIKYLKWKGVSLSESLAGDAQNAILEAVKKFGHAKNLELHDEFDPICYEISEDGRINLDYYKNNIIHFFVSASCLASIMLSFMRRGNLKPQATELKEPYTFCKRLFAHEFAFSTRMEIESHIQRILSYFGESDGGTAMLELYKGFITNFFESYLIAVTACKNLDQIDERGLIKIMIKCGHHMLLLGRITMPEAISTPIFKNAVSNFVSLGILKAETTSKGHKIYSWAGKDEIAENLKLKLEELC